MCLYESSTCSYSSLRKRPLSTKIQCRLAPIAWCSNTAATDESTPPDKPKTTLSSPSFSFNAAMVVSTNESGVQSCLQWQISTKKLCSNCLPSVLCVTSGGNCMA